MKLWSLGVGVIVLFFQNLDHHLTQWLLSCNQMQSPALDLKISLWIFGLLLFDILPKSAFVGMD